ncbi:flagellar hook-basal body complex protein FliE [uncultured Leclercia sp.]|uniref:flagellar hook-basal body complex protein FliE n=1 Tax=uncultured Leclercia sp. TaxID=332959 RepID=UPI002597A240|nr:flagellar hook-basal body complex protein FliE [uncultured Leclercia sp.]
MDKIQGLAPQGAYAALLQRMQQNAISAATSPIAPAGGNVSPSTVSFGDALNHALNRVDGIQHSAAAKQTAVETGISDDLTGALVESQKASVAFSALVQVRNKLTSALDDVLNLAV